MNALKMNSMAYIEKVEGHDVEIMESLTSRNHKEMFEENENIAKNNNNDITLGNDEQLLGSPIIEHVLVQK